MGSESFKSSKSHFKYIKLVFKVFTYWFCGWTQLSEALSWPNFLHRKDLSFYTNNIHEKERTFHTSYVVPAIMEQSPTFIPHKPEET